MDNRKINDKLVNFWNEALLLSSEEKEQIRKEGGLSLKDLAPSQKLFDAASSLGKCHKVLDFGCGNGWGAIIAYKSGCQDVEAVDLGDNIIDSEKFYASLFDARLMLIQFHQIG